MQALVGTSLADSLEGLELLKVVSDLHGANSLDSRFDGHNSSCKLNSLRQLLGSSITLAWLLGVQREQDQLGLVLLQALSIQLQRLHTLVPATVVNSNANCLGVFLAQASSLELFKGESPASPLLQVVLVSWTTHDGPQLSQRPGGNTGSLLDSVLAAPDFPGRLVEPSLNITLPILVKMAIWHDVVSL